MKKSISHIQFTDTIGLTECPDGFWLYDKTRGMNLAMSAKTKDDAFIEALSYYQKRLAEVESSYKTLNEKVNLFVHQFVVDDDNPLHY